MFELRTNRSEVFRCRVEVTFSRNRVTGSWAGWNIEPHPGNNLRLIHLMLIQAETGMKDWVFKVKVLTGKGHIGQVTDWSDQWTIIQFKQLFLILDLYTGYFVLVQGHIRIFLPFCLGIISNCRADDSLLYAEYHVLADPLHINLFWWYKPRFN